MSDFGPGTEMLHFPWTFPSSCWIPLMKGHLLLLGKKTTFKEGSFNDVLNCKRRKCCSDVLENSTLGTFLFNQHLWVGKKPGQGLTIHVMEQGEAKKNHLDPAGATGAVNSQSFIRKLAVSFFFFPMVSTSWSNGRFGLRWTLRSLPTKAIPWLWDPTNSSSSLQVTLVAQRRCQTSVIQQINKWEIQLFFPLFFWIISWFLLLVLLVFGVAKSDQELLVFHQCRPVTSSWSLGMQE